MQEERDCAWITHPKLPPLGIQNFRPTAPLHILYEGVLLSHLKFLAFMLAISLLLGCDSHREKVVWDVQYEVGSEPMRLISHANVKVRADGGTATKVGITLPWSDTYSLEEGQIASVTASAESPKPPPGVPVELGIPVVLQVCIYGKPHNEPWPDERNVYGKPIPINCQSVIESGILTVTASWKVGSKCTFNKNTGNYLCPK